MKRILIISLIVIACAAAGYYFLFEKKIQFSTDTSVFRAVPIDAPFFIEIPSVKDFPKNNETMAALFQAGFFNQLSGLITKLDSLFGNTENINHSLVNEPFVVVLNLEGREEISPVIIVKSESAKKKKEFEKVISLLFPENKCSYNPRQYNGEEIIDIKLQSGSDFSYSFTKGLLICGERSLMVEKAIRQMVTESLVDNSIFRKAQKTATHQTEASVYVNHQYFPELLSLFVNDVTEKKANEFGEEVRFNIKNNVASFSNYATWSELDLSAKPNEIRLNGVSMAPDSLHQFLTVFQKQDPVKIRIDNVMPRNTAMFYSIAFSKKEAFFKKLDEYFTHSPKFYKREEKIKLVESSARADLKPVFETLAEDEAALVYSDILSEPGQQNVYFILSVEAASQAKEEMLDWLGKYASRKSIDLGKMQSAYNIDNETTFPVYRFPYPSFPGIWLGEPFAAAQANYFSFWNNYMIFADTQAALEKLLHDLLLGSTLAEDPIYSNIKDKTENKANINFFLNINNAYNLNGEFFNNELNHQFKDKEEILRKFSAINWQVVSTENFLFNNILLNYSEKIEEDAKTTWQSNIGSTISLKPGLVINHYDTENKEIIVQDDQNQLHLLTKEGRARWSIKIAGKILGTIHQVDYLRNGKLQYLFNTKDKFYLIDREGNNVSPFPLALRSPATNGLNVFDYDNNRKYRYFVAGEDKKIYCYDGSGKIVSGWKFGQTDHEVTTPVQHFRVGNKDYIVFKDKTKIYVQNRQGQTRVSYDVNFENSRNPVILNLDGTPKMVVTDIIGDVYYFYFDGNFTKKETPGFSKDHFFNTADINGDNKPEFVFIDNDELTVLNENGKKLFNEKFRNGIDFEPNIYTFSSTVKKIGVVDKKANRIYLFNPDGSLHKGFPLHGNSEFSIGKISEGTNYFNLIVGSNNGSIYNYRLD